MAHIDMTKPARELNPGIDLWKVGAAEETRSRAGDLMFKLKFKRVSNPADGFYERIMLEGGGAEIGQEKLKAFLKPDHVGDVDASEFVGVRVWAATMVNTYKKDDGSTASNLQTNIAELKHKGLQREDDVPPGHSLPDPGESVPF